MTEPQRQQLRQLIDQARRQRLHRDKQRAITDPLPNLEGYEGHRPCVYCGKPFKLSSVPWNAQRQRFCRQTHKANWWRRERMRRDAERKRQRAQVAA